MQAAQAGKIQSDINVTPFIDIVLVLLIIFMVITPIILQETVVNLPKMEVTDDEVDPTVPGTLVVKLNADNSMALRVGDAEEVVNQSQLVEKLTTQLAARTDKSVFIDASTMVNYGQVVTIFDLVKGVGWDPVNQKGATLAVVETDDNPDAEGDAAPAGAPASP